MKTWSTATRHRRWCSVVGQQRVIAHSDTGALSARTDTLSRSHAQLLSPRLARCSVATNADHRGGAAPAQIARLEAWLAAAGGDLTAVEMRASEVRRFAKVSR